MNKLLVLAALTAVSVAAHAGWKEDMKKAAQAQAQQKMEQQLGLPQASPPGAKAYFVNLKDGDTVASTFTVNFGLKGMGVAPAGSNVEGTGHFHLLIDNPTIDYTKPLPSSAQVVHFGGGQIETEVTLKPGKHTLQILMADWKHQPHSPPVQSQSISITVK